MSLISLPKRCDYLDPLSSTKLKLRTAESGGRKWECDMKGGRATMPGTICKGGCSCSGHVGNRGKTNTLLFSSASIVGQQQHSSWQNFADGYFLPNCHLSWWGKMILLISLLTLFTLSSYFRFLCIWN